MRARALSVVMLAAVAIGGCRKSPPPAPDASAAPPAAQAPAAAPAANVPEPPAATAAPATMPPGLAQIAVDVGVGGDSTNGVATGQVDFPPGSVLTGAVDVSVLPQGAIVKVGWLDANGRRLGEDSRVVPGEAGWLLFVAPSGGWPEGTYRVDVSASTGGNATRSFRIVAPVTDEPAATREPG